MTWAKLSDDFYDDPVMVELARGHRLMWIEAVVWCCKHETDGHFPASAVRRFTDEPNTDQAVEALVVAGLWALTDAGYRITGFLDQQRSKADIDKARAENALTQRRRRQHRDGDHSLCIRGRYCPDGALSPRDSAPDTRGESSQPDPTRPDPSEGKGKGRVERAAGRDSVAPPPPFADMKIVLAPLPPELLEDTA